MSLPDSRRSDGLGSAGRSPRRRTRTPWRKTRSPGRTNRTNDARRRLEKGRLHFEAVAAGLREDLVFLEDLLHVERRDGRLDFFRPPAAAERSDAGVDEAEHVQL